MTDYEKYRGKCKEMSEALIKENPELRLARGWYHCPIDGKEQHWWCEDKEGNVIDPTVKQFKTKGAAAYYEEYRGILECSECGKEIKEEEADIEGRYCFCSLKCHMRFVGL